MVVPDSQLKLLLPAYHFWGSLKKLSGRESEPNCDYNVISLTPFLHSISNKFIEQFLRAKYLILLMLVTVLLHDRDHLSRAVLHFSYKQVHEQLCHAVSSTITADEKISR